MSRLPINRLPVVMTVIVATLITTRISAQDGGVTDAPPVARGSAAEITAAIGRAEAAMASEDWKIASEAWGEVVRLDPTLAGAAYNQGVSRYRSGDFEESAESFQRAAELGDANLAAQSMYNEGTARYAEALERLEKVARLHVPHAHVPLVRARRAQLAARDVHQLHASHALGVRALVGHHILRQIRAVG